MSTIEGPYQPAIIVARVEARRRELGLAAKSVYTKLGLEKWDWSRRINLKVPFTVGELSKLCVILSGGTGFPFVDPVVSEIIDAQRGRGA